MNRIERALMPCWRGCREVTWHRLRRRKRYAEVAGTRDVTATEWDCEECPKRKENENAEAN